jgi:organic radical activating enzyme
MIPVYERFVTFQGEGRFMGIPAFFIRSYGCPVHCPYCDSAGTWHPDYVPESIDRLEEDQLIEEVLAAKVPMVVVTGGEPTIHDWTRFLIQLHKHRLFAVLETSGTFPIRGAFDWVVVSPKRWKDPVEGPITAACEFKFIIETPEDIDFYLQQIQRYGFDPDSDTRHIWLHPEWSKRTDRSVLKAISDRVVHGQGRFRAGWQIHKLYGVDLFDSRSRPPVPLGGQAGRESV